MTPNEQRLFYKALKQFEEEFGADPWTLEYRERGLMEAQDIKEEMEGGQN